MSFQFCLAFVFLGRKCRLGCMPWLMLQFPIFFFSTSLSALRLCEGRSQAWGCTFGVGWLSPERCPGVGSPVPGRGGAAVLPLLSKTPCVSLTPFVTSSLSPRNT